MTTTPRETRKPARLGRRIIGSFLGVLLAWFTFNAFYLGAALFNSRSQDWWVDAALVALYSAAFSFGTWLVALLPLHLLIPSHSFLWHWPVCTLFGTIAGASIFLAYCHIYYPRAELLGLTSMAAVVGGLACLFSSLIRRRFQFERTDHK